MWGQHLTVDLAGGRLDAVRSAAIIRRFASELVAAIQMRAFGEPTVAHFAEHSEKAAGWTLVQLIETSSITGHFCDATGDAYLDVFSCQAFDVRPVLELLEQTFRPERMHWAHFKRQAGQPIQHWDGGLVVRGASHLPLVPSQQVA